MDIHSRASGWRWDDANRVRSSMATMATMATPRVRPPKYILELVGGGVNYRTLTSVFYFYFNLLRVAKVAMVAMR